MHEWEKGSGWTSMLHIWASAQICLASYLGHLLPVSLGIKGCFCEQGRVLLRCYPQFVVEGVVPDLFGTKVRWVQETSSGLESPHWHVRAVEVWYNVLRVGWVWGGELSALRISDWPLEVIFLLSRAQTGFRPGANTRSVLIISIRPSLLFPLDSSPFSPLLCAQCGQTHCIS